MTTPKPSSAAPVPGQREDIELEPLTEAQREFLDDLRVRLIQMKNGDVMPALEALREIEREIELEENGSRPDA